MRYLLATFAISLGLLLITGDSGMTQTATPASPTPISKRALRHQDREECTKQAAQQNIIQRNQADFIRKCMGERQGERKAAAKKKTSEDRRMQRGMAIEEGAAILELRNRERREQLEQQAAKRADCNKQANEQKLRVAQRRSFVKKCVAQ